MTACVTPLAAVSSRLVTIMESWYQWRLGGIDRIIPGVCICRPFSGLYSWEVHSISEL